jgi:hypothetical protein
VAAVATAEVTAARPRVEEAAVGVEVVVAVVAGCRPAAEARAGRVAVEARAAPAAEAADRSQRRD